jgi:hypothetical protein
MPIVSRSRMFAEISFSDTTRSGPTKLIQLIASRSTEHDLNRRHGQRNRDGDQH